MEYYYPDNLAGQNLFANFWNGKDMAILSGLFVLSVLAVVAFSFFYLFLVLFAYAILSAKIANGYSITRVAILYIRFLITDILLYKWR